MTHAARSRFGFIAGAGALVLIGLSGCGGGGPPAFPPPTVNVAAVVKKSVTEWDDFSGRIEAVESIELRPRATGYLAAVHFRDGAEVHKGDLLFTIDDREYRAAADNARANLARADTRVEVAGTALSRTETLAGVGAASVEELEQRRGEAKQAKADRDAAASQLRQAELSLSFTRVTAPIDGRIGKAEVRPGNLVTAGSTLLSTLVSIDPVYVAFEGNERAYLRYQALAREGSRPSSRDARNPVRVGLASEAGYPHQGEMVFVDNQLDPSTGTIRARALLSNKDRVFTPGLFARVQLVGGQVRESLFVHERAILTDQDRKYVYVIGPNNSTLRKDVELGAAVDGLRLIAKGLSEGDLVVVNGTRKIFAAGQPVTPVRVPMDQPEFQPPPAAAAKQ
ncbi:MAG: efflux RND transporter periplasmic adaptor subunit [Proteobacteria bacterium]|nr:efflux RND transporter periplasmic adaptor subunit [Pseudomonadota bacterium]